MDAWTIESSDDVEEQMEKVEKFYQPIIRRRIEEELTYAPFIKTKNKKALTKIPTEWLHLGLPIWQLTVDPYRIQYCIDKTGVLKILIIEIFRKDREKKIPLKRRTP